ncbi:MAG: hypothetical protein ACI8QD_000623 [Cyclobacteriaceae bacterium]|jgi:hypothetical protein
MLRSTIVGLGLLLFSQLAESQDLKIAKLQYDGGGDWYANKTALPNLIAFTNQQLKTTISVDEDVVEVGSPDLFLYPYIYMTGHGNVRFSEVQAKNLRKYLLAGGFLHVDDNYGLDPFFRLEIKRIFPDKQLVEIPFNHPIYHQKFDFDDGLPKIHEHDGLPAQGFGIIHEGRLICFYSYESDLGNGWEDQNIHKDPESKRLEALRMGANIISYVFSGNE